MSGNQRSPLERGNCEEIAITGNSWGVFIFSVANTHAFLRTTHPGLLAQITSISHLPLSRGDRISAKTYPIWSVSLRCATKRPTSVKKRQENSPVGPAQY
jgi:hypothetical protein